MEVPSLEPYGHEDWPAPQKGHAAMITRLDRDVGALVRAVDELGLIGDTLFLFTSDNGPATNGGADPDFFDSRGGLRGAKGSLYEGGLRVPLIVRWPGRVAAGRTTDVVSAFEDWLPTLVTLAGGPPAPALDGVDLGPTLFGRRHQPQPALRYWELGARQALLAGDWKLVRRWESAPEGAGHLFHDELYDLARDPTEARDLAAAEPERRAALAAALTRAREPSARFPAAYDRAHAVRTR